MLIIPVMAVTSKCLSSESRGRERIEGTVDGSYASSDRLSTPPRPALSYVFPKKEKLSDVRRCIYIVERYNGALYNS